MFWKKAVIAFLEYELRDDESLQALGFGATLSAGDGGVDAGVLYNLNTVSFSHMPLLI